MAIASRNSWRLLAAAALAAVFGGAGPAAAADVVRLGNPAGDDFHFSMANVGIGAGTFKKYGLDVQITSLAGGAKLHQALTAGSLDIGLGAGTDFGLIVKGAPEKGVGVLSDLPTNMVLQASARSKITTLAGLKGKSVGVSSYGALTYWLAKKFSVTQGWGADGVQIVPTGGQQGTTAGFVSGTLDGAVTSLEGGLRVEAAGEGRTLLNFSQIVHPFITHVIYATDDMMTDHPAVLRRFLRGWYDTVAYANSHKAETIHFSQAVTLLPDDLASKVYDIEMKTFSTTGRFEPAGVEAVKQAMIDLGVVAEKPDDKTIFTEAFLPGS